MTAWFEGRKGFYLGAQAALIQDEREVADSWASKHITYNPAYKWVVGRFVEADRANNNRQLFSLPGLQMARPSIKNAPMNMNHEYRHVVGAYVAADLIYPTDESGLNPHIEALGVFWKHYFQADYAAGEMAHAEGMLAFSMECVPREIQCSGVGGCGARFPYVGRQDSSYCEHLNHTTSDKLLIDPHFTAGALLIPPVKPGWSQAEVHSLVSQHANLAEQIYEGVKTEFSHLAPSEWENLMHQLLVSVEK